MTEADRERCAVALEDLRLAYRRLAAKETDPRKSRDFDIRHDTIQYAQGVIRALPLEPKRGDDDAA